MLYSRYSTLRSVLRPRVVSGFFETRALARVQSRTVSQARTSSSRIRGKAISLGVVSALGLALGTWYTRNICQHDCSSDGVIVDSEVSPFPLTLCPPGLPVSTHYNLLGAGIRSVSIISFKAYALGIYISDEDERKVPEIWSREWLQSMFPGTDTTLSHKENVRLALKDAKKSEIMFNRLMDEKVRLLARLTPIRNASFKMLREGIVKNVKNFAGSSIYSEDIIQQGIHELEGVLQGKGPIPRDDDFILELLPNGSVRFLLHRKRRDEIIEIGTVKEPVIGRYLFLQYVSGANPVSEETRAAVVEKLATIA